MSDPFSNLSEWHAAQLALLVDALGDPPMTFPEKASLAIIANNDEVTVENLAGLFRRVAQANRFTGDTTTVTATNNEQLER